MLQHKSGYFKGPLMVTVGLWSVRVIARSPESHSGDVWMDFGSYEAVKEMCTFNLTFLFLSYNFLVSTA